MTPEVKIKRVGPVVVDLPKYQTAGAAAFDLCAALEDPLMLEVGERWLIPTGLAMAIPEGYVGLVCPRSGLAIRAGITVNNAPGVVDSDYRGEVKVILINHSKMPVFIEPLSRIAQMVIAPVTQAKLTLVDELDDTARGSGGFGSTGVSEAPSSVTSPEASA